jgi:hypothetical protein
VKRLLLLGVLAVSCHAQPTAVELFGHVGVTRTGDDEGSLGPAVAVGGALMVPLRPRWAIDVDVQAARRSDDNFAGNQFRLRRIMFSPAIVYRRGSERVYGFVGGGAGGQFDETRITGVREPVAGSQFAFTSENTTSGLTLHGKGGLVAQIFTNFLIRADGFVAFRYVLPDAGVRIGIGYRF